VLDGLAAFLRGARCLLDQRDFVAREATPAPQLPERVLERWRERLRQPGAPDEHESMQLLLEAGLPALATRIVNDEREARAAAQAIGAPVVLKTAMRGIDHKSDIDGVRLGLADADATAAAYRELAARIGPRALVAPMVRSSGIEMLLGMIRDEQFGPGRRHGVRRTARRSARRRRLSVAAVRRDDARRRLAQLRLYPLLGSRRHRRPLAVEAFCSVAARFRRWSRALPMP
jgi:hypothetical protein